MTTLHIYPIKHAPIFIALSLPLFLLVFLSDDCNIQFKLAYLSHLPVMALVFCYHLYWLTRLSLWRWALTGYLSVCASENVWGGRLFGGCGGRDVER